MYTIELGLRVKVYSSMFYTSVSFIMFVIYESEMLITGHLQFTIEK